MNPSLSDLHSMQLNVKIEDERGQFKYLSVTTKKDSTLAASLENVLSGLPSYVITGPNPKITWQTPAYHLKVHKTFFLLYAWGPLH